MARANMAEENKKAKNRRRFYYNCAVSGCLNSTLNTNLTFFSIPSDDERRQLWLERIRREDLIGKPAQHARICEVHFDPTELLSSTKRKVLKKTSVPVPVLPATFFVSKETQTIDTGEWREYAVQVAVKTEPVDEDDDDQPEYRQLLLQDHNYTLPQIQGSANETIEKQNHVPIDLQQANYTQTLVYPGDNVNNVFSRLCDTFLSKNLANVIKEQKNLRFNSTGNRYSAEYKLFCLRLYLTSPKAYNLLKETLCLPSKTSLNSMDMPLTAEINISLMEILKRKILVTPDMEKNCLLIIDTMNLKPNLYYNIKEDKIYGFHEIDETQPPELAKQALVAMVHGISENYKQLVGYALLGEHQTMERTSEWIDKLIQRLFEIGFNVRVMISTLTSDFFGIAMKKSVTKETPYFIVDNKRIYYIFDASQLIILVRNNLLKYNIQFKRKEEGLVEEASWEFIKQFYQKDKLKKLRTAPNLTESHLQPNDAERGKTELAVQLFSYPVAAGMSIYRDFDEISPLAGGTINLVEIMNNLFEFLNSTQHNSDVKYKNAYCAEGYQTSFLIDMMNFFASLKLYNPRTFQYAEEEEVSFIDGFQITLKSILLFYQDIQIEHKIFTLETKRLSRDCLESFFHEVRTNTPTTNANSISPTSWQLAKAFQKFIFLNDWKEPKKKNYGDTEPKILLKEGNTYANLDPDASTNAKGTRNERSLLRPLDFTGLIKTEKDEEMEIVEHDVLGRTSNLQQAGATKKIPPIFKTDYDRLSLPKKHALVYLSGFLLKKCSDQHEVYCFCKCHSESDTNFFAKEETYVRYNDYFNDVEKDLELKPPDKFVNFVELLEEQFINFFKQTHNDAKVVKTLLERTKNITLAMHCACLSIEYCKVLYFRLRIFFALKDSNCSKQNRNKPFSIVELK